jgi:hypothetical protein
MAQSSGPLFIVFISAVSPPRREIHCFTLVGQHVGGVAIVRHPDARGVRLVEIGRVKPEPCAGGDANAVERDDPQDQGTGGVALAVDDHPFAAVAYGGVFELVLMNEPAVVLADPIIRTGAARRCGDHASGAQDGQEEIGKTQTPAPHRHAARSYPCRRAEI